MKTPEQQISSYKKELADYKKWVDSLGLRPTDNPMAILDTGDWNKIQSWNEKIIGMEEVLGLTKEEVRQFCLEAGIKLP